MLDKLRALFDGKTTTRLVLAGVAIAWGIQTITDTIRELEARADELAELIATRELLLASLDKDLRDVEGDSFTFPIINGYPDYVDATAPPTPFSATVTHDLDVSFNQESVEQFNAMLDAREEVAP